MGRHPTYDRKYEVQKMWERHHEIVRLTLLGNTQVDIAHMLGCTPQNVSDVLNSKIVRDKLQILRAERDASTVDVAAAIKNLAPKAVEVVDALLAKESCSDAVKLRAAMDILDRNGHAAPKVLHTKNLHGVFTKEDLEEIKKQGLALAIEAQVIDE